MIVCLYTKHKTQKKKTYHDGHVIRSATKLTLLNDAGVSIDSMAQSATEWTRDFPHFDFPKFLVDIDEDVYTGNNALPSTGSVPYPGPEGVAKTAPPSSFGRPGGGSVKPPPGKYVPPRNKFQPPKRKYDEDAGEAIENKNAADFTRTFTLQRPQHEQPLHHPPPSTSTRAPTARSHVSAPGMSAKKSRYDYNNEDMPCTEVIPVIRTSSNHPKSSMVDTTSDLSKLVSSEWPEMPKPLPRTYDEIRRLLGVLDDP
ncbi:hypothetical protein H257_01561 [Aphanomyces astaci]|uniref:5'-3' DNA helicase ZGRF1-like N-terminal domain-containing protein n=1 Tax=Aphanomyces astaci TaxID=112090 RepID=W4H9M7_APHAT|nr:hypothetical protein H257_01561 [Aphanomyces astaci]ETV88266.1 hypothetical protein H257_01561 [Aphanomyces astaci]|eukprot:XP_009823129.1 hypothetical protein H257_01561 [Aphanomyces astaci]